MNKLSREHRALIYILENVEGLKIRMTQIYDLETNRLKLNYVEENKCFDLSELGLSSSEESLLRSGINLYNGSDNITLLESFCLLDNYNQRILMNALEIRFNMQY